ncbi:S1C family serine protease [Siccirubricoccus sp. KC 17139]|uniref:S1C family serine protease n=1 Tax=Siccirubricoccus soli TaxID=2899147 RepID=A0ABT1D8A1_9PROT|nr:S1C family serine protease [Siccirubricoccus soli]MCO6418099.1 S1C family serine protease [Siccirubricoccus soli]MCP2684234.1 S1C family serine protease [Siccirubricoccus soli]
MASSEWEIPPELQPDPTEHDFDLDLALRSIVGVKALVPADAFTAQSLGTERGGSGVVIRPDGLIATIGYLVTEAETIWLTTHDGRAIPGHALAYDFETGFGLIQALGKLDLPALPLESGEAPKPGDVCVLASAGGRKHALRCTVAARQEFAGYWEYMLEEALFTAPAHPSWGGAGLIGGDGRLMGIGSLVMQQQDGKGRRVDLNMVVPASLLPPVLEDLLSFGRPNKPARPWLGLYAAEDEEGVVVSSMARGGPAQKAGLHEGDRVTAVGDTKVTELTGLWRAVWASGHAGAKVRLSISRQGVAREIVLASVDRRSFLKAPRLH